MPPAKEISKKEEYEEFTDVQAGDDFLRSESADIRREIGMCTQTRRYCREQVVVPAQFCQSCEARQRRLVLFVAAIYQLSVIADTTHRQCVYTIIRQVQISQRVIH
jgi:hypothetical protein